MELFHVVAIPAVLVARALVTATYVVECFSIVVQGLSVGPLVKRLQSRSALEEPPPGAARVR